MLLRLLKMDAGGGGYSAELAHETRLCTLLLRSEVMRPIKRHQTPETLYHNWVDVFKINSYNNQVFSTCDSEKSGRDRECDTVIGRGRPSSVGRARGF